MMVQIGDDKDKATGKLLWITMEEQISGWEILQPDRSNYWYMVFERKVWE
jgi:hypothetical protein